MPEVNLPKGSIFSIEMPPGLVEPVSSMPVKLISERLSLKGETLRFKLPKDLNAGTHYDIIFVPVKRPMIEGELFSGKITDEDGDVIEEFEEIPLGNGI